MQVFCKAWRPGERKLCLAIKAEKGREKKERKMPPNFGKGHATVAPKKKKKVQPTSINKGIDCCA